MSENQAAQQLAASVAEARASRLEALQAQQAEARSRRQEILHVYYYIILYIYMIDIIIYYLKITICNPLYVFPASSRLPSYVKYMQIARESGNRHGITVGRQPLPPACARACRWLRLSSWRLPKLREEKRLLRAFEICSSYHIILYHIILYYIILYYIILYYIIFYSILFYSILFYSILFYYIILCYVMLCYVMLCYVMLYYIMLYYIILYYILLCFVLYYIDIY